MCDGRSCSLTFQGHVWQARLLQLGLCPRLLSPQVFQLAVVPVPGRPSTVEQGWTSLMAKGHVSRQASPCLALASHRGYATTAPLCSMCPSSTSNAITPFNVQSLFLTHKGARGSF